MDNSQVILTQTWLSLLIGASVAYIAIQQYKSEKLRQKYELYDKRLKIFQGLMDFLAVIIRDGHINENALQQFHINTNESYFLFGKDNVIVNYLTNITDNSIQLQLTFDKLNSNLPIGEERSSLAEKRSNLLIWFTNQTEESKKVFSKYLVLK